MIFDLSDGVYNCLTEAVTSTVADRPPFNAVPGEALTTTGSYDVLVRLATLQECIEDAIATRQKLTSDINALMAGGAQGYFSQDRLIRKQDLLSSVQGGVAQERRHTSTLQTRLRKSQAELHNRRSAMTKGRLAHQAALDDISCDTLPSERRRDACHQTEADLTAQRRRVCSDLSNLYPINSLPNKPLAFTIRGCAIPNATFVGHDEHVIAAGLGHVAQVVHLLTFYLATALPYPITSASSTSSIRDPISSMSGSRVFPLYATGAIFFRFEYGVFLLNKDIELLASKLGLRLLDIRQTLPNLKYVLFVATAGTGDLPARRAGGVRALLMGGRGESSTPDSSRRSSFEGAKPAQARLKEQLAKRNGLGIDHAAANGTC